MPFIDLALSRRLERAEGQACRAFADVRRRLDPASGATSIECAGAYAVFDGISSPVTQTFGLGLFEETTPAALDEIERFFEDRGAKVHHEVSPLSGVAITDRLCARGYPPWHAAPGWNSRFESPTRVRDRCVCVNLFHPSSL